MSERSTYLRDQAAKCRWHASQMDDAEAQEQLRTLAAAFIMRAVVIENEEPSYGPRK
jgi:hypothetical protein